ncbi:MAG: 4Fe-4S dicluster domain-containing protein [Planctomycetota bacterium]|nr:4Fe-4S dicluster domain-containing protein [Planctomycetota bacterium]
MRKSPLVTALRNAIRRCDLNLCVQCGACSAVCPMTEVFDDLPYAALPRSIVRRFLLSQPTTEEVRALLSDARFWFCLTCDECARRCPAGVKLNEFAAGMRQLAVDNDIRAGAALCASCGTFFSTRRAVDRARHAFRKIAAGKAVSQKNPTDQDKAAAESFGLCPKCRMYAAGRKIAGSRLRAGREFSPVREQS